jgi:hypothetical protein
MVKVFLSYSHLDAARVLIIEAALKKSEFDTWTDQRLIGGQLWKEQVVAAIESADFFVLFVSANAVISKHVLSELDLASGADVRVVPIVLDGTEIPSAWRYQLAGVQRIEAGSDLNELITELKKSLRFSEPAHSLNERVNTQRIVDGRLAALDQIATLAEKVSQAIYENKVGDKSKWAEELIGAADRYQDAIPKLHEPMREVAARINKYSFDCARREKYCCDELILDIKAVQYQLLKLLVESQGIEIIKTIELMQKGVGEFERIDPEEPERQRKAREEKRKQDYLQKWKNGITFPGWVAVTGGANALNDNDE